MTQLEGGEEVNDSLYVMGTATTPAEKLWKDRNYRKAEQELKVKQADGKITNKQFYRETKAVKKKQMEKQKKQAVRQRKIQYMINKLTGNGQQDSLAQVAKDIVKMKASVFMLKVIQFAGALLAPLFSILLVVAIPVVIPIISGSRTPVFDVCEAKKVALELGFPIMIKAAAGGGGKGMRISNTEDDFNENFVTAQMEANSSFRDGTMYLERYIEAPNHIEFQILADKYGNVIQLGERDCSIQRHHQKIIEEAPSPKLSVKLRKEMGNIAIKVAKIVNYEGAGTVEFLLDKFGKYYFIEMNTRIQVEHGITEMISNVDIVKEQIKIAAGYSLEFKQENILLQGHAIECRINAENPKMGFVPCPGKINNVYFPSGNGVRIDTALFNGCSVSPFYDSMLAKIIVYDSERKKAIRKMKNVLKKIKIDGIITNLEFQNAILNHRDFEEGNFTTDFIVDKFS